MSSSSEINPLISIIDTGSQIQLNRALNENRSTGRQLIDALLFALQNNKYEMVYELFHYITNSYILNDFISQYVSQDRMNDILSQIVESLNIYHETMDAEQYFDQIVNEVEQELNDDEFETSLSDMQQQSNQVVQRANELLEQARMNEINEASQQGQLTRRRRRRRRRRSSEEELPIYHANSFEHETYNRMPGLPPGQIMEPGEIIPGYFIQGYVQEEEEPTCVICLLPFQVGQNIGVIRHCQHQFHDQCIRTYIMQYTRNCPLCRGNIGFGKRKFKLDNYLFGIK